MLLRSNRLFSFTQYVAWQPPTDVYETEDGLAVQVEIAGMRDGNLQVSLENRLLVISGVRDDPAAERRAYHQMEIRSGEFRIEIEIPIPVDARGIEAHYEDGFLRVILKRPDVVRVSLSESE